ncbi:MAG: serine/threonine-protein kinase [Phormidesmis sp.]
MNGEGGPETSVAPLGDRYTVIEELGRSGFGQTYLAKDHHRFEELCVVQEFLPQVEDKVMLTKAKDLFEREANVLYQLEHKQIPEFHELLEVTSDNSGRLFLVQDYVPGPSYQALLADRQRFGGKFTETEITQLLYQLLPVLSYIHSLELVHRDVSPENLILRQTDGLPVLIDFGSVKEIAATVRTQVGFEDTRSIPTHIGKAGYVPQEQLSMGEGDPTSDLYGLAATMLVLATGESPQILNDPYQGTWSGYERLSPQLANILKKMLSANPQERFPTAEAVLVALRDAENSAENAVDGDADSDMDAMGDSSMYPASAGFMAGTAIADAHYANEPATAMIEADPSMSVYPGTVDTAADESEVYETDGAPEARRLGRPDPKQAMLGLLILLGIGGVVLLLAMLLRLLTSPNTADTIPSVDPDTQEVISGGAFSPEERARQREIEARREALGLGSEYFERLVDQLFYQEYPNLLTSGPEGGRQSISDAPGDEPLRIRRDHTALNLLAQLEQNFSDRSLSSLGSYSDANESQWRSQINPVNVKLRSLYDLVDTQFFRLFPTQSGRDFLTEPTGQLYYAIADDTAREIGSGNLATEIQLDNSFREDVSGQLAPAAGQIYTIRLAAGQLLRMNLTAPTESTLLSLYPPESSGEAPAIFADSAQATWSGALNRSGYYEIVVINRSVESISYQLSVSVDNVSVDEATPSEPATPPEETEEDNSRTEDGADAESTSDETTGETTSEAANETAGETPSNE